MEDKVQVNREEKSKLSSWFSSEPLSVYLISGLLFLLPLFFIPFIGISVQFSKFILLTLVVLVISGIWIVQRLKDGVFSLPVNLLSLSGLSVLIVMIVSSLFSGNMQTSFMGQGFETDTVLFFTFCFIIFALVSIVFTNKKQILSAYGVFMLCLLTLGLFHIGRLFLPSFLSLGVLNGTTATLIGKWNDLALFFGLGTLLSLITLESLPINKIVRGIIYGVLVISIFFLAIINFSLIWYLVGGLSLVLFVYGIVMGRAQQKTSEAVSLPIAPGVVLIISVIFIFAGQIIGDKLASKLDVSQAEVRPTLQGTMDIAKEVIFQKSLVKPLFGVGPNNFELAWLKYKPADINTTIFWDTSFTSGVGIIPSSLVTTGTLGFIAWVVFLGALVYMGFRSILSKSSDSLLQYLTVSSFIGSLYLWLLMVVYVPSLSMIVLAFIFTGLFVASLTISGVLNSVRIEYFKNQKTGFISVFVLIVVLITGIGCAYIFVTKIVSAQYYQKALIAINSQDFTSAQNNLKQSIRYNPNDSYYRDLAQVYMMNLATVISQANDKTPTSILQEQFTTLSNSALEVGKLAVAYNPLNYRNHATLGDVWASLVPYGVQGAYENAISSYNKVIELNPQGPAIYLQLARVETAKNDVPKAKNYIEQAVRMKYNYTDAYYLLAQLQISQGNVKDAISAVATAALTEKNNSGLFYQLGLLYYNEKDYKNAVTAFTQAVSLSPQYANALYYLGLSLYEVDAVSDAISAFEKVQALNPESEAVGDIIKNLKAGKTPLAPVSAKSDTKDTD